MPLVVIRDITERRGDSGVFRFEWVEFGVMVVIVGRGDQKSSLGRFMCGGIVVYRKSLKPGEGTRL